MRTTSDFRQLVETWIACYEGLNTKEISDEKGKSILSWLLNRIELGRTGIEKGNKRASVFFANGGTDFIGKIAYSFRDKIYLNKNLIGIKEVGNKILLKFESGEQISASYVILTVPFPLLKNINIDESLWNNSYKNLSLTTLKSGENTKILIPVKANKADCPFALTPRFTAWWNSDRNVLTVYFGGKDSRISFETPEDREKILSEILSDLYKFYPCLKNQKVIVSNCVFMNWNDDKFSKGSYSFVQNGKESDYDLIINKFNQPCRRVFEPLKNRVFFAGEHTSINNPSTMEGAVESGERIANMVIYKTRNR